MINQLFSDIYNERDTQDAIINDRYTGFKEDYLTLHCLLRKYKPKTLLEIGTNSGFGTKIIKNALGPDSIIYSLDLPDEEADKSLQHPSKESRGGTGAECDLPYTQLLGDSLEFDFSKYPCEAYFVDGEHDYEHPYTETMELLVVKPKLVIYHDADMPDVFNAIIDAFARTRKIDYYDLFRVTDTRILYALRK